MYYQSLILARAAKEPISLLETYYGKDRVRDVERAADVVCAEIRNHPDVRMTDHPANKKLCDEFCKLFGFKHCRIVWTDPSVSRGCTIPTCKLIDVSGNRSITKGWSKTKGYYDTNHSMYVFIQMDQADVSRIGMTGAECTAVILHEIGHNFDNSTWGIAAYLITLLDLYVDMFLSVDPSDLSDIIQTSAAAVLVPLINNTTLGRAFALELMRFDELLYMLPESIRNGVRKALQVADDIRDFIYQLVPVGIVKDITRYIHIADPLQVSIIMGRGFIKSFGTRKQEIFADSFATAYGYGPELSEFLHKYEVYNSSNKIVAGPLGDIIDEWAMLRRDVLGAALYDDHGTASQRTLANIASLNWSMQEAGLTSEEKKVINVEIKRLMKTYTKISQIDNSNRYILAKGFREMINGLIGDRKFMDQLPLNFAK